MLVKSSREANPNTTNTARTSVSTAKLGRCGIADYVLRNGSASLSSQRSNSTPKVRANASTTAGLASSIVTGRAHSPVRLVTPKLEMPHGTMSSKGARSLSQLSAIPCMETQRRTLMPIAAS